MAPAVEISEPIAISKIAGRYLLFDIDVVTYLRRVHNICGVLVGGIPQVPQQNVFLGLPVELLPEEALVLIKRNVAYIVDDEGLHKNSFCSLRGSEKRKYLESFRQEARTAQRSAVKVAGKRAELGLAKQAAMRTSKKLALNPQKGLNSQPVSNQFEVHDDDCLSPPSPSSQSSISGHKSYSLTVTTATTRHASCLPSKSSQKDEPYVPLSYSLFAHLHAREYFITPGLRFGCDYTVYPGDPLRFHSHFLAMGYQWDQKIPMIDLIGGGRLGTGVKKGYLIGGKDPTLETMPSGEDVRTFCIEWGGM